MTDLVAWTALNPTVNPAALERLIDRAREMESWGLVVMHGGRVVAERNFGRPPACNLMSATKSVTSMAIGALLTDGKLKSVDAKVRDIFPSFTGGGREKVTVRHLLEHTSGLELYSGDLPVNRVAAALKAKVLTKPGTVFAYNNRAVDLLSGVVRRLGGMPLDDYVGQRIFRPLGIGRSDYYWMRDPDGNPHGCAELVMRPRDLAKLGQLMLQNGMWQGKRVLGQRYIREATTASKITDGTGEPCGWLWWVSQPWFTFDEGSLGNLARNGLTPEGAARLRPLVGQKWPNYGHMGRDIMRRYGGVPRWSREIGSFDWGRLAANAPEDPWEDAYFAEGWGGQIMFVFPKRRLVVVRTGGSGFFQAEDATKYEASDLYRLCRALVPAGGPMSR